MNQPYESSKENLTQEFVKNPSAITKHLVGIVLSLNEKYEKQLGNKNFLKRFIFNVRVKTYIRYDYRDFYSFWKGYFPAKRTAEGVEKLKYLFEEFEKIYESIIFHNMAVAYEYTLSKDISFEVSTMEDLKGIFLRKLFLGEIKKEEFMVQFGHCALNAYELSSPRFEEYSEDELFKMNYLRLPGLPQI